MLFKCAFSFFCSAIFTKFSPVLDSFCLEQTELRFQVFNFTGLVCRYTTFFSGSFWRFRKESLTKGGWGAFYGGIILFWRFYLCGLLRRTSRGGFGGCASWR